jgi:hypothetical protein
MPPKDVARAERLPVVRAGKVTHDTRTILLPATARTFRSSSSGAVRKPSRLSDVPMECHREVPMLSRLSVIGAIAGLLFLFAGLVQSGTYVAATAIGMAALLALACVLIRLKQCRPDILGAGRKLL